MKGVLPVFLFVYCCWYIAKPPAGERVVHVASLYVGHVETAHNQSPVIDHWNKRMGLPPGSNYCATFISFVLDSAQAQYPHVRSAVAQHFITNNSIPSSHVAGGREIPQGYIAVWKRGTSWMGHVEVVRKPWSGPSGHTIGANTTPGNQGDQSRGNGVYKRQRHIDPTAFLRLSHFTPVH